MKENEMKYNVGTKATKKKYMKTTNHKKKNEIHRVCTANLNEVKQKATETVCIHQNKMFNVLIRFFSFCCFQDVVFVVIWLLCHFFLAFFFFHICVSLLPREFFAS